MGYYTGQPNDGVATISREEQQAQVAAATVTMLDGLAPPARVAPGRQPGLPGSPTKRSPSSAYWPSSGADGASSIRSEPDWVLGKAMTSRMFVW